jgi:death-on-curing protein
VFIDGNKRIAAVTAELFLEMNGVKLGATNEEIIEVFLDIAASRLTREEVEERFASWLNPNTKDNE